MIHQEFENNLLFLSQDVWDSDKTCPWLVCTVGIPSPMTSAAGASTCPGQWSHGHPFILGCTSPPVCHSSQHCRQLFTMSLILREKALVKVPKEGDTYCLTSPFSFLLVSPFFLFCQT